MSFLLEETSEQKGAPVSYESVSHMRGSTVTVSINGMH